MNPNNNNDGEAIFNIPGQEMLALLFTCAIQGTQTIGLHCVELLVNISRDEKAWRLASLQLMSRASPKPQIRTGRPSRGTKSAVSSIVAAATSWENALLFILKIVLHWLLGQCLQSNFVGSDGQSFNMMYIRIFAFSIVACLLAVFATYLAWQRPSGPQPAAWGHLQTLADLVDDWEMDTDGKMYWGDKGVNADGTRHAGTSAKAEVLGMIKMDASYS